MNTNTNFCIFSGCTRHNASIRENIPIPSTIRQPVSESPTGIPAIYTEMKRSQNFAYVLELPEVECVYDQACYAEACQLLSASPVEVGNVVNRIHAFHTIQVFVLYIFKMYGDASPLDIIKESGTVASGSLQRVVTGHHYKRSVRTRKLGFGPGPWFGLWFLSRNPGHFPRDFSYCPGISRVAHFFMN